MTVERRKHVRLKVNNSALTSLSRCPTVAGNIIDISEGGLSFRYIASQRRSKESPRLHLLATDERFHFKTLPFKSVWDSPIRDDFSFESISTRHCGVEFGYLTDDEKDHLKYFIHNTTKPNKKA
jgi:hypothetical protein